VEAETAEAGTVEAETAEAGTAAAETVAAAVRVAMMAETVEEVKAGRVAETAVVEMAAEAVVAAMTTANAVSLL
jgi:hypothetical protein